MLLNKPVSRATAPALYTFPAGAALVSRCCPLALFPAIATFLGKALLIVFLGLGALLTAPAVCAFAAENTSLATLEKRLATEQKKAKERRASLEKLTDQERRLNADLAKAEREIQDAEARLQKLEEQLGVLTKSDKAAAEEYEQIEAELAKTLAARQETMRLLWVVTVKREGVGSRDMLDWDATDREYRWSHELLRALGQHQQELQGKREELEALLARRAKYAEEVEANFTKVKAEKDALLASRIKFSQNLTRVRSQKDDTEAELTRLLTLVESLNYQIETAGGNLPDLKGRLPWPVKGTVKKRFAPSGNPPCRGVGLSTAEGAIVQAIAPGRVVHNDLLRGFGTVVIVQHGEEYYSLYAFLGKSPLKIGDSVAKDGRIGTVGFYPDIHGPGMYFELRFRQKAINPEQWLKSSR